jgi:hypothetical protein
MNDLGILEWFTDRYLAHRRPGSESGTRSFTLTAFVAMRGTPFQIQGHPNHYLIKL